jgi:F-type H+-transporting ATPase subunit alpha
VDAIRSHGAPEQTVFVVANSDSAPGLQWIAPFAGFTIAEYFRDSGRHALVIIDDMTKHAATHREIALLTRQPPGREAFPGDVFHVHARLLERAAKLAPAAGGGSLTALPIAELDAGNLSAYIPTNLISITDGQIVLDSRLFREGVKPAVDIGVSVSRVGGKTQSPALRAASKSLRLDFAQFLELEIFTRFGGMSDARVKEKIARGLRIRAVLNQPQFAPLPLAHQVALVTALQHGVLDLLPVERVAEFRDRLTEWLGGAAAATVERINRTGDLSQIDETELVELLARCAGELIQDAPAMRTRRSRDGTPG